MFFRIVCVLIVLAGSYVLYELWRQNSFYANIRNPSLDFVVLNPNAKGVTIVDFANYECLACRMTSKMVEEYVKTDPDTKLVVRPVPFKGEGIEYAVKMTLAAGLQGKFWEMHDSIINYANKTDEAFFKQTSALYNLNYDQMAKDGESEKIFTIMKANAQAAYSTGMKTSPAVMVGKSFYQPQGALTLPELIRMIRFEKTGSE